MKLSTCLIGQKIREYEIRKIEAVHLTADPNPNVFLLQFRFTDDQHQQHYAEVMLTASVLYIERL